MIDIERLVQIHLLQQILPNRDKAFLNLVQFPQKLVRFLVYLDCFVLRHMLLLAALEHNGLVCTYVRDTLVQHAVILEVVGSATLIAASYFATVILLLLEIDILSVQIKRLLVGPLSSDSLAVLVCFKVLHILFLLLEPEVFAHGTLLCGLVDRAHLISDVRRTVIEGLFL